jgi:hypothetical protein
MLYQPMATLTYYLRGSSLNMQTKEDDQNCNPMNGFHPALPYIVPNHSSRPFFALVLFRVGDSAMIQGMLQMRFQVAIEPMN